MKMRTVLFLIFLIYTPYAAIASETQGCEQIAAKFFDLLSEGKSGEAVDSVFKTNPYLDKVADAIVQVKSSLASSEKLIGNYRDSSLILDKKLGDRVIYLYYLAAFERQPIKFEFLCYKPNEKWVIQNLFFSDKVLDDIRDFVKYDLFKKPK